MSDVIKKTKILLNPHPGRLPPPKSKFLSVILMALLPGAALGAVVSFEILSTSGSNLSATFEFSGSLDTDGTFNFDSSGNPLTNPSFSVSYVASTNVSGNSSPTYPHGLLLAMMPGCNSINQRHGMGVSPIYFVFLKPSTLSSLFPYARD